ncbi:TetR/AcrR family transcriptional regulator [Streptomyces beijiangensis]|uniref:TetR/AcrR family transcriptional regulator n=1 Tax=Streptomyces beijiangensis TaxID=163361 RepID=A0A939F2V5_9ACTN|nr:TetR/AcrR family transcriptional regulator [Streptomyces beijiangensis]MBO0511536.1 TetR/AcrR family transcriptional regulator [Streptomyces beijiangensis]
MTAISGGKSGYHHGDLRNALITAAVELATDGGPEKVVLREAARRVGVSPTAAYRHFAGQADLLYAVKVHGQQALADSMEQAAAEAPRSEDPGEAAELRLAAIGRGYVRFALRQPGLYRAAFCSPHLISDEKEWGGVTPAGTEPEYRAFVLLTDALDALVASGRMPEGNRPAAEAAAWAAVHGLCMLILDGPMRRLPDPVREVVVERTVAMVTAGLIAP